MCGKEKQDASTRCRRRTNTHHTKHKRNTRVKPAEKAHLCSPSPKALTNAESPLMVKSITYVTPSCADVLSWEQAPTMPTHGKTEAQVNIADLAESTGRIKGAYVKQFLEASRRIDKQQRRKRQESVSAGGFSLSTMTTKVYTWKQCTPALCVVCV